jgi:lipoyl synthase
MAAPLRVRWLGNVPYAEALAVQRALFSHGAEQHLLLVEHPHVFTYGRTADLAANLRCEPGDVGAELIAVDRGGDITYHGPGQLVGYPIVNVATRHGAPGGPADVPGHVAAIETLVIDTLAEFGVSDAGRICGRPGVWVGVSGADPRKICAIGVRVARGRSMHGFALNVCPDLTYMRDHIVPCGIDDMGVTSLAELGVRAELHDVVDVIARLAAERFADGAVERQDVAFVHRPDDLSAFSRSGGAVRGDRARMRLEDAGVAEGLGITERKPEWLRPRIRHGAEVLALRKTLSELRLVTVCEEAGCPNLSECWADGTATFMVLGERCTRACGFCLVDTRRPEAPDPDEPHRVAEAIDRLGLSHAVLTMVARDDLTDGGMGHVARCVEAIRSRRPGTIVETLVSDARGDVSALEELFRVRPDVFNHNLETVARLQRAVRPSAGYARSLGVLARAKTEGLLVKSGIMLGLGETAAEIEGCLADLASIGVDIVTIGQYLRPTTAHLPVTRYVHPDEFENWATTGERLGIGHVESAPLTRSSHHARQATDRARDRATERLDGSSARQDVPVSIAAYGRSASK